jgi:peroxiredoxin
MLAAPVLAARLLLAGVLAVAAVAKLADLRGSERAAADCGVPEALAPAVGLGLPLAELAVAVLLLPSATAFAGAVGAVALLALFSAAIAVSLRRGRAPDCHCFGQLHSAPAGPSSLARNAVLAAIAAFAIAGTLSGSATSAVAWIGDLDATERAIAGAAVALLTAGAVAFLLLLRSYGQLLLRVEVLEHGERGPQLPRRAPDFTATTTEGTEVALHDLLAPGVPLMLIFASPDCTPCDALLPDVAVWQSEHAGRIRLAVASSGDAEDVRAEAEELELDDVLVDEGSELYRAFHANGTPSAVLIGPDGAIASSMASGPDRIKALLAAAVRAPDVPVGAPAPAVELPSLDGERVNLADLRGRETLLLFWNPACGYCRAMHDELLAWESTVNGESPRLVVVSSGGEEATRSERFRSTVLLDDELVAGNRFGARGTPMALLLDADGRVASPLAAGPDAVLALRAGAATPSPG